jgi:endoglycosylceramidase
MLLTGCASPSAAENSPAAALPSLSAPVGPLDSLGLRVTARQFIDDTGRVVILRGVNLAGNSKVPPFLPNANGADLDRMVDLGINVIRLVFIWEAFEPTRGVYDDVYLHELIRVAELAAERGIRTIVDIHQDGFSRYASRGSGDGFPSWAISPRGKASKPDNGPSCKNWPFLMATDPTTHKSFDDFYANVNGVRDRYLAMLSRISTRFAATRGVIGYDLLNEPWGNEEKELAPLYQDAASVIRIGHPSAILFLEGHITTNSGLGSKLPRPAFDNVAYAPHYYKPSAIVLNRWDGSTLAIRKAFSEMTSKAISWNAPLLLGEFGLDANASHAGDYVASIYEQLDIAFASGTQWNYTPGWTAERKDGWNDEDFNILDPATFRPRPNFRPRPYPRAIAGAPVRFAYRSDGGHSDGPFLEISWEHNPERGHTELFIPRWLFPAAGSIVEASPEVTCVWDPARQLLTCRASQPARVTVRIDAPAPR